MDVKQFRLTISDGIDYVEYISRTKFLIISSRNVLMKLNYKVTDHSCKVTYPTELFSVNVVEQLIGHQSFEAVR